MCCWGNKGKSTYTLNDSRKCTQHLHRRRKKLRRVMEPAALPSVDSTKPDREQLSFASRQRWLQEHAAEAHEQAAAAANEEAVQVSPPETRQQVVGAANADDSRALVLYQPPVEHQAPLQVMVGLQAEIPDVCHMVVF